MQNLRAIVTLGRISHESTVVALEQRRSAAPFGHGRWHDVGRLRVFVSYHCSRYNTSTGVLTPDMFRDVFAAARAYLASEHSLHGYPRRSQRPLAAGFDPVMNPLVKSFLQKRRARAHL